MSKEQIDYEELAKPLLKQIEGLTLDGPSIVECIRALREVAEFFAAKSSFYVPHAIKNGEDPSEVEVKPTVNCPCCSYVGPMPKET